MRTKIKTVFSADVCGDLFIHGLCTAEGHNIIDFHIIRGTIVVKKVNIHTRNIFRILSIFMILEEGGIDGFIMYFVEKIVCD